MNGVDRTKFNRAAAAPYKGRQVIWHGQPGSFRDDAQGNLVWTPDSGASLGSNGIEDITGKLGVATGQAGGMQYQYDPATGGVTHTGGVLSLAPPPPPPSPGAVQEPSGPGQQGQSPGPSFPSEEAKSQSAMFSAAFGSSQGDPNFNVNFDYNQDGIINYSDQLQFGQSFAPPPPADSPTQEIDDSIQSMVATAGDQRTAWGQPYTPEYYSRYQDGYRTYLEGLGEKARAKALEAPHKTYRNYVIDQLEATPQLGNVLRGAWTPEDVNAIAQSILSGEGILSLDHINSIPEELLSGSQKSHIEKVVNEAATRVSSRDAANLPFDLRMKRSNYLLDQAERDGLISRSDREAFNQHVGTLSAAEQTAAVDNPLVAISQFLNRTFATKPDGAVGDPPGEATDQRVGEGDVGSLQDPFRGVIRSIAAQMGFEDYDPATGEPYLRTSLADQGYTPEQVERIIQEARKEATEGIAAGDTIFNQMQSGTFDEDATRAQLLQEGYTPNEVSALIANATTRYEESLTPVDDPPVDDPSVDDRVDEGIPPGWVDADNDGFDDNTNLDIDGNPRVFTQEGPEQFEGTATKPVMPDTDDTINDIVTYLRDASETQDGIDNIAADDLNQLSTSAERAQEQLLEDLNRLGLVGLESGDAQAAIGEFKGKVLAEQSRIRRESDERIRDNIDKLINVAGIEVSEKEAEARIKELEESIKSADQRALFQGVMEVLGPDGFDVLKTAGNVVKDWLDFGDDKGGDDDKERPELPMTEVPGDQPEDIPDMTPTDKDATPDFSQVFSKSGTTGLDFNLEDGNWVRVVDDSTFGHRVETLTNSKTGEEIQFSHYPEDSPLSSRAIVTDAGGQLTHQVEFLKNGEIHSTLITRDGYAPGKIGVNRDYTTKQIPDPDDPRGYRVEGFRGDSHRRLASNLKKDFLIQAAYQVLQHGFTFEAVGETVAGLSDSLARQTAAEAVRNGDPVAAVVITVMSMGSQKLDDLYGSGKHWRNIKSKIENGNMSPSDWSNLREDSLSAVATRHGFDPGDATWAQTHNAIMHRAPKDPLRMMYTAANVKTMERMNAEYSTQINAADDAIEYVIDNWDRNDLNRMGKLNAVYAAIDNAEGDTRSAFKTLLRGRVISEDTYEAALEQIKAEES